MAETPIKHTDIFEEKIIQPTIDQFNEFNKILSLTEDGLKKVAAVIGKKISVADPKTISDLEQFTADLEKLKKVQGAVTESERLHIQVQELQKKKTKEIRDEIKGQVSAYQSLQNEYARAAQKAKDLAAAQGIGSKAAKLAAQEANTLNDKLKQIDSTLGNHQRNVGNYTNTLKELASTLGLTLSIGALIEFGKASLEAFVEAEHNAKQLNLAITNIAGEGRGSFDRLMKLSEELQKKGIFSDDDIQKAETMAINFGLNGKAVEELIPKVTDFAAATGQDLNSALEAVLKGIEGSGKGLKLYGVQVDATASKEQNYSSILEQLNKFQGANIEQLDTLQGRTKRFENAIDDLKEGIGEFIVNEGNKYLDLLDLISGKTSIDALATRHIIELFDARNKVIIDKATEGDKAFIDLQEGAIIKRINLLKDEIKTANEERLKGIITQIGQEKKLLEELEKLRTQPTKSGFTRGEKEKKKQIKKEIIEPIEEGATKEIEITKDKNEQLEIIENDFSDKINQLKEEKRLEDLANARRARKEQFAETIGMIDEITKGIAEGLQKRSELQQQADQRDIDMHARMLEVQAKLAAEGKANVLGETMAQTAKAEEKKLQDAKKAAKQQETLALIDTFEKTLQAALKAGKPFLQAFGEALASEGLVSAAFSKLFAGFYEGTEDTGTVANPIDDKGGRLTITHDNERIVPKRLNDMLGGISNEELVNRAIAMPNIVESPVSMADFNNRQMSEMTKEIKALRQDMAQRPIQSNRLDALGEWTEQITEKNVTTIIHHKKSSSRPSLRLNG